MFPLSDMFVASGNVSVRVPVPRFTFDRIVQPKSNDGAGGGLVWFDAAWSNVTVEGIVAPC